MTNYLLVATGGALGSVLRFWLAALVATRGHVIWGTLAVNVIGSLLIGMAAQAKDKTFVLHFVMIGIMGGFTTFSAFSLQTMQLLEEGRLALAALNIVLSVVVCLFAVWLGLRLGRIIS